MSSIDPVQVFANTQRRALVMSTLSVLVVCLSLGFSVYVLAKLRSEVADLEIRKETLNQEIADLEKNLQTVNQTNNDLLRFKGLSRPEPAAAGPANTCRPASEIVDVALRRWLPKPTDVGYRDKWIRSIESRIKSVRDLVYELAMQPDGFVEQLVAEHPNDDYQAIRIIHREFRGQGGLSRDEIANDVKQIWTDEWGRNAGGSRIDRLRGLINFDLSPSIYLARFGSLSTLPYTAHPEVALCRVKLYACGNGVVTTGGTGFCADRLTPVGYAAVETDNAEAPTVFEVTADIGPGFKGYGTSDSRHQGPTRTVGYLATQSEGAQIYQVVGGSPVCHQQNGVLVTDSHPQHLSKYGCVAKPFGYAMDETR